MAPSGSNAYDVIVAGLGGMGSATARHLAARGRRVLGLEQFTPAHDRGSSHGRSRIIRQSYFEDPAYVPLLLRAYELWAEAEKDSGAELLTLTGGLYLGPEESTTFAGSLAAAREWDLPHEVLDGDAVRARFPTFTPAPGDRAVYEQRAGFVRPEASVATHLDLAARDGADLRFGQKVLGWEPTTDGVRVRTAAGEHTAGQLVVAPGSWAPQLLADLGVPLRVERQVQHWFDPVGGVGPYVDHPVYITEQRLSDGSGADGAGAPASGNQIYGFPATDGPSGGAKVAFFRRGRETDPDHLDRAVTMAEIDEMRARLRTILPTLAGRSVQQIACMYTTTPDEHFVIARHPGHDRVTVACGFSGHGFKFVPVVGEILADLAVDGTTRHPIALFDPPEVRVTDLASPDAAPAAAPDLSVSTAGRPAGSLIRTLPGSAYTDAEVFAREQERIFERMWTCVARAADLDGVGAFRTVTVGRESVVLVRGRDRAVRGFLNVCRHRGARICIEPEGQVRRNLQCAYHAWTYDLTGKLIAAPNLTSMPDVDRVAYGLIRVTVREWLGYVWVCLADEPPSFEDDVISEVVTRLGDVLSLDNYDVDGLALGRRITYDVAANWKLIVENFMECYHCATIHPELTEVLPEFADGYAAQYYVGHGAEFAPGVAGFTVDGRAGAAKLPGVRDDQDRRYYAITIKPQVFVNLVPDHVILHRMTPLAPDRTIVECDWLFAPEVIAAGADLGASVELFHRVNAQDFDACERTQPGMASRAYAAGGVLVPSEHHIGFFHEWVQARLA